MESSHTNESFMVKLFTNSNPLRKGEGGLGPFPCVLRLDKEGHAAYTKDYGGICILFSSPRLNIFVS